MNYCFACKKLTESYEEELEWSKIFKLVVVHCAKCKVFKYQYLKKIGENSNDRY